MRTTTVGVTILMAAVMALVGWMTASPIELPRPRVASFARVPREAIEADAAPVAARGVNDDVPPDRTDVRPSRRIGEVPVVGRIRRGRDAGGVRWSSARIGRRFVAEAPDGPWPGAAEHPADGAVADGDPEGPERAIALQDRLTALGYTGVTEMAEAVRRATDVPENRGVEITLERAADGQAVVTRHIVPAESSADDGEGED